MIKVVDYEVKTSEILLARVRVQSRTLSTFELICDVCKSERVTLQVGKDKDNRPVYALLCICNGLSKYASRR